MPKFIPLPLADAQAYLAANSTRWTAERNAEADAQGWNLFNFEPTELLTCGIERLDEADVFESDDHAFAYVAVWALTSETHCLAHEIHLACDSLRYHIWGPDWIDSRVGPHGNPGVWRIVSGKPNTVSATYWSNRDGWGGLAYSDGFTPTERGTLNLPMGGIWWLDIDEDELPIL